ncbi:hypothetical protein SVIOM74S_10301 [Streptomyces violarus]
MSMTTTYTAQPIAARVLKELRTTDDAGRPAVPFTDSEGGAPLRCCLGRSEPGQRIALVSYAPLRRWAAEQGVDPGAAVERTRAPTAGGVLDGTDSAKQRRTPRCSAVRGCLPW